MNMNRVILGLVIAADCSGTAMAQVENTAYGAYALASNTGNFDSAFGYNALFKNTTGNYNTAIGQAALQSNTTGDGNTATGEGALAFNTTGTNNVANGQEALLANAGRGNTASGNFALRGNASGSYNVATGINALYSNTTGSNNTASGSGALHGNTIGIRNVALGSNALYKNTTGQNNVGIGYQAGYYPAKGSNNIEIGAAGAVSDNAVVRIGTQGTQKAAYLAGVSGVNVTGGAAVVVNSAGQLGVVSSSRRYKEDIRSMGDASDRLLALRPVTFRYKKADASGQKPEQYGLIAEEVATVMPELVVYNEKGQPETVAYQTLAPLLLNELQREHTQMQREHIALLALRSRLAEVDTLRAELRELRRAIGATASARSR